MLNVRRVVFLAVGLVLLVVATFSLLGQSLASTVTSSSVVFMPQIFSTNQFPFFDDFSNPASGWPITTNSIDNLGYVNGQYRVQFIQPGYIDYAGHNLYASDFQVAVDASTDTSANGSLGLYFSYNFGVGRYIFDVAPGFGEFQILERDYVSNAWVTVLPPTSSSAILTGGQSNRLRIVRAGSLVTFYINNQQVYQFTATLGAGYVGLEGSAFAVTDDAFFDNFGMSFSATQTITSANRPASQVPFAADRNVAEPAGPGLTGPTR